MKKAIAVGVLLAIAGAVAASAAVTLKEETVDGKPAYRLENYRVSLVITPSRGGAVTSYKDRLGGDVELIPPGARNGLAMDHFQCQPWPGELLDAGYEGRIVKQAPDECAVAVTYRVPGRWEATEYPKLAGVLLEKTYTLRDRSPALEVKVKLTAPPKSSTLVDYWLQNVFFAGGQFDFDSDVSFRPSTRGVRAKSDRKNGFTGPEDFLRDFSDGWVALLDTKARSGLVVLSDYNDLRFLYVCGSSRTLEPMFEVAYLPAGASREYAVSIVPVAGLDNVVAATADYVAGYRMQSDNKGSGSVELAVVRSARDVRELAVDVSVLNVDVTGRVAKAGTAAFGPLGDAPQTGRVAFAGAGPDPLVVRGESKATPTAGGAATHRFEDYFNGAYQWGENLQTDMATPRYRGVRPPRELRLNRPADLRVSQPWEMRMWYIESLLDDCYGVTEAVRLTKGAEAKPGWDRAFVSSSIFGDKLSSFPYDYGDLLGYAYVVLGGVRQDGLGEIGVEMLCDYLKAGGGMVVLGGPMAYGKSQLAGSKLEEMWPVSVHKGDSDIVDIQGAPIEVADPSAVFLMDLDWSAKPAVRYLHDVDVKPWGKVVLTSGGKPFVVVGESGPRKARVICIMGAPMGTMEPGKTPFWEWRDWRYLMRQVFWWTQPYWDHHIFAMP